MAPESDRETPIRRALLSVHDKAGLETLARTLSAAGVELWATEGSRRGLEAGSIPVRAAEELTGIGSWFGGRIKTLHPGVLGGILAPRTEEGRRELAERGLVSFDLVVVNFYPFELHLSERPAADDREEFIDIGGVTLARAAAKNHAFVGVLTDPSQYPAFLEEFHRAGGAVSAESRRRMAVRAFERCTEYDAAIAFGLRPEAEKGFPEQVVFHREPMKLRYGENPHQAAAVYRGVPPGGTGVSPAPIELLKGDALSFTNLLDLDTALGIVAEFSDPAAAIVKHATPCGVASGPTVLAALEGAIATDPVARYGCAIAVNRPLGPEDVPVLHGVFVDLLAAPGFDAVAREQLDRRPKIKLVRADPPSIERPRWEAKSALGRLLLQEADRRELLPGEFRLVTTRAASAQERTALEFAWKVVRHAKSNAIVLASGSRTVGIGSGQPTRVKAVELAVEVAGERAHGAVLASDAFFPFADGLDVAGRAGVRAVLQPGGSVRDADVIAAAERHGTSMYFTGWRAFRH
ncbi:MAG: bifunctional phosphoribosylaminoimidazolecarboxamide formyltransferase/IMP cyclohydrolase [Thermoplasmata archaeon]